jgi:photosystem II stability/assembly factor-like uncharacterized protein
MKNLRYFFILVFLLIATAIVHGQQKKSVTDIYMNSPTDDFATIRQNAEEYFKGRDQGRGSGYTQWKRWEYFNETRLDPDGKITNVTARNWDAYYSYVQQHQNNGDSYLYSSYGYWTCKGPFGYTNGAGWNPGIGRVNVICFHPTDPDIFWVGTPDGGLWKTTAGGNSWTPLTDGMPLIGVSGIAVQPNNTDIMYILTGDGDGDHTKSIGVLKTIDGGVTWLSTGLSWSVTDAKRGYKLLMHPTNYNTLFAATSDGVYKTINGGSSWTKVLSGWIMDIEFKPNDPSTVYACSATDFYISPNTGNNFGHIITGVPTNCWRMAIGVSPAAPVVVYLFTGPSYSVGHFTGVYRSMNSGASFDLRSDAPNLLGYLANGQDTAHQTTWDLAIAVSRLFDGDLIVGGINTWKSGDYGFTWGITSMWNDYLSTSVGYTHADIHDLSINPLNNWLYCCSDGGVFRSTDFGDNWTDLSAGLCNTQFYRIAGLEEDANLIIGGTQDNGTNKWTGGPTVKHILGADGMDCIIDHYSPNIMYYESQRGNLKKSYNGGFTFTPIAPALNGPWVTHLLMSPSDNLVLYAGYDTIRKTTNGGTSWLKIGIGQAWGNGPLAMGTNNTNVIYASNFISPASDIWRSDNEGGTWTNIRSNLPGSCAITRIAVNPDNASDVFITEGNYFAGEKVYASSDGGVSWINISGTLPNVPVNCIVYEDNNGSPDDALYIGTDIGIFYRNANMSDWIPFMNGLPNVSVMDLEINKTAGLIRAGTFGRGLWSSNRYASCELSNYLTVANDPGNPNYTGIQYYEAIEFVESSRIVTGGLGTNVVYKAGDYVKMTTGFRVMKNNVFKASLGPCNALDRPNSIIPVTGTYAGPMMEIHK